MFVLMVPSYCCVSQNSLTAVDDNKTMEDLGQGVPNMEEGNADGVVNYLVRSLL